MNKKISKIEDSTFFEKQQTIDAIKVVVKARWFFTALTIAQVLALKLAAANIALTSTPVAFVLVIIELSFNLFYWLYLRRPPEMISSRGLQTVKIMQIIIDELLITAILYLNGTVNSLSSAFFLITIMIGSVLYQKQGVIWAAILASYLYTFLAILEYYGFFIYIPNQEAANLFTIKGNLAALNRQIIAFDFYAAATSFFAAYFADLFRNREKRLKKQKLEADEARHAELVERNKVESVIHNLSTGLIVLDQSGKIVLLNNQAEKIFNLKRANVINKTMKEVGWPFEKLWLMIDTKKNLPIIKKEIQYQEPNEIVLEVSVTDLLDFKNKILGKIIVLNDVTREKAMEKMKSEFITITAHQLRTPLSAVKWALSLIMNQEMGPVTKEQKKVLEQGFKSNEQMIVLINELLNLTTIEEGKYAYNITKVSFIDLVKKTLDNYQTFAQVKNIKIKLEVPKMDKLPVNIDGEKIQLVMQNLIENAINYSPAKATVTISVDSDKDNLIFTIKDQGIGIPEKEKSRLFTKFFRGEKAVRMITEGNGLGLYITKNIIEGHGGEIWFDSEAGQGSTFYFTLPYKKS